MISVQMSNRGAICNEAARLAGRIGNDARYNQVVSVVREISEYNPTSSVAAALTCAFMVEMEHRPFQIRAFVLSALLDIACEVQS